MKRIIGTIALLAVVSASCSSGLSDAESVWCQSNRKAVAGSGSALGLTTLDGNGAVLVSYYWEGVTKEYELTDGSYTFGAGTITVSFASQGDYDRACKAAYEGR